MSWEKMSEKKERCPCGNSTYSIITESDDWGRLDESWVMNCPSCQKDYFLSENHSIDRDGLDYIIRSWNPV